MKIKKEEIVCRIIAHVGILSKDRSGWSKEVNIVSWNDGPARIDIRSWSPDHEKRSRGITLNGDEAQRLIDSVQARDAVGMLQEIESSVREKSFER